MALATKVYEQAAKENQNTQDSQSEPKEEKKTKKGDDDAIDAEYEEN